MERDNHFFLEGYILDRNARNAFKGLDDTLRSIRKTISLKQSCFDKLSYPNEVQDVKYKEVRKKNTLCQDHIQKQTCCS
ncbi:hypothetical protein Fmac_018510 [Flemingia macrophylla]|uniref:Uncharacterized protein n=1 Tax=Flemingia macrophylla TaxID=520843 RepID=A0ABD1M563_9FABA